MQGDDSTEVNLSFELKGKMLKVNAIRILNLNNYLLPVNYANYVKYFLHVKKIKY